mgnify:CR=1 FL=1
MPFNEDRSTMVDNIQQAINAGNEEKAAEAFLALTESIRDEVLEQAQQDIAGRMNAQDTSILQARGARQLTSEEREYYMAFIEAAKDSNPKQAVTNLDKALPRTVIDSVMDEVVHEHQLLEVIKFQNTTAMTEFVVNRGSKQLAVWGKLCDEITKELEGDIDVISLTFAKLSAWIPVCKSMLEVGPEWLDAYVRAILKEAIAFGLEEGIINGTGVDQPVGMSRDLAVFTPGTGYTEKTAVAVTSFAPEAYGAELAKLAVDRNGAQRKLGQVVLIVNPVDFLTKVMPATTMLVPGGYQKDIFPYPTTVIQSVAVGAGKAILGLADRYFMGIGTEASGKIEHSDDFKFLEDARTYKTRLLGNGFPLDNTSFEVLDISGLKPLVLPVNDVGGGA